MPLPRRIPLLPRPSLRRRPFVCLQCRLLSSTGTSFAAIRPPPAHEEQETVDGKAGRYIFSGGRRIWRPAGGIREIMEAKEKEIREKLENDLKPQLAPPLSGSQVIGAGLGSRNPENMRGEDWEDEMVQSLSGFQRMRLGELAELRASSGLVELGVFLQNARSEDQLGNAEFLTVHGIVRVHFSSRVMFSIPDFIPEDIMATFKETYDRMDERLRAQLASGTKGDWVIPPELSGPLVSRIRDFQKKTQKLYFGKTTQFGQLYDQLAEEETTQEITTNEAAEIVFGEDPTPEQLYATHAALTEDGLRFTGDKGYHRYTSRWRIRSKRDLKMISTVTSWLRTATDASIGKQPKIPAQLVEFIDKAVTLIDLSRQKFKDGRGKPVEETEVPEMAWSRFDLLIIDFMKARLRGYGMQRTPLDSLTPFILRRTGRYEDKVFDGAMIFTFLHEIGAYKPWENLVLHSPFARAPNFGLSVTTDQQQAAYDNIKSFEELKLTDSMAGLRKDWGDMPIYAVDDADAHEIDDGISIEKISDSESWVHVHVANPTSHLPPSHWISSVAQNRASTLYAKPYVAPMLPPSITGPLGISKDHPVFTISSKVNHHTGEVLDIKMQPGIARRVVRLTYTQFGELVGARPDSFRVITSGYPRLPVSTPQPPLPNLSAADLETLKHIHETGLNLIRRRVKASMISLTGTNFYPSLPSDPAAFPLTTADSASLRHPVVYSGIPPINTLITNHPNPVNANSIVAEFMILANSSTAVFMSEHSIPAPFRVAELDPTRPDLHDFYLNQLLPSRDEFGHSPLIVSDVTKFFQIGVMKLQAERGGQAFMGLPGGYVRATSPLRRFADCITHWNLEAFIRSGGDPAAVPFPREALEAVLPQLDMRERMNRFISDESERLLHGLAIRGAMAEAEVAAQSGDDPNAMLEWNTPFVVHITKWGMSGGGGAAQGTPGRGYSGYLACSVKVAEKERPVLGMARAAGRNKVWAKVTGFNVGERMLEVEAVDVA